MLAFHNDEKIKQKYLSRVRAHAAADEIIKGTYWEEGKGCAVGCTIHSEDHNAYETELGIPEWLAHLEDRLFERMPLEDSMLWPERFLKAIKTGTDLEQVKAPFLIFTLESVLDDFDHDKNPEVLKCVQRVIGLYKNGGTPAEFRSASAAGAAASAASAAYAAASAAYAAAYAADAAAYAAGAADAADVADVAAVARAKLLADKLIELIESLPSKE